MILAFCLATIDQHPEPEEAVLDPRPVMTPVSFRHFPYPPHSSARERLSQHYPRRRHTSDIPECPTIPSLRQLLLHHFRVQPTGLNLRHNQELLENLLVSKALENNVPFYLHYNIEPPTSRKPSRKHVDQRPRVMYLSSASLVVVPLNLLHQWESEIHKHCLDEALSVYVAEDTKQLPHATKLASCYDVCSFLLVCVINDSDKLGRLFL